MAQTAELAAAYGELAAAYNHAAVRFEFGDPAEAARPLAPVTETANAAC